MNILPRHPGRAAARVIVRHPAKTAAAAVAVVGLLTVTIVVSGIIPIRASSGHWPVTNWLLDFTKVRSVATHSLPIDAPPLEDEALMVRGAAHFDLGCAPCHGRLEPVIPPVMAAMTPPPPTLADHVGRWKAEELFTIVKHGIKFTGMPAWPARDRDDEVWAVVAFLQRLPTLNEAGYRALARGDAVAAANNTRLPRIVREICARCHGVDGAGRGGAFPRLAGQRPEYLSGALVAFADRRRSSGMMASIAAALSDEDRREATNYFQSLSPGTSSLPADPSSSERGAAIATSGLTTRDIPPCRKCHGPDSSPKNPAYPRLAGQHASYLLAQLDLFVARRRGGSGYETLMHAFVDRLNPDERRDVVTYYSGLREP